MPGETVTIPAGIKHWHGEAQFPLSNTDPEYAALMKKYIYGDIAQQVKLEPVERALVTVSVLTTNQNEKLLAAAVEEALAVKATPLQIRESVYHITPYVGFAKTAAAVEIMKKGVVLVSIPALLPDV